MRRVLAPLTSLAFVGLVTLGVSAGPNPPVPPPAGPVNAPAPSALTPSPSPPLPETAPSPIAPVTPSPLPSATQPPIIVEPPQVGVEPGRRISARINSALGTVTATVADPTIAGAIVDQAQRLLYVDGLKLGTTTITLSDARGVTRDVPVRVAYDAGTPADEIALRVTGDPASPEYLRAALAAAVERAATLRPGASANVVPDAIPLRSELRRDDRTQVDVPVTLAGNGYFTVTGATHVVVQNDALPPIEPARLLVSDYPERLTADGVLFTARLDTATPQRFLYYHYNPGTEPARRILLKAHNGSNAPATIQMVEGSAGPEPNEMDAGHLSTRRFLVREAGNEGTILTIPPGQTMNLVDHPLPPESIVSGILELRLVDGAPIDLTLLAQHLDAPLDQSIASTQLLSGGAPHARGVYPVPTFYVDRTYAVDGPDLAIPIGELPLPNLRQGEALAGDYGVEQSVTIVIVNQTRGPRAVALYANPRGGKATGTFLIDGALVQAHGLPAFSKFKIWQETIDAGTFRRVHVVTMPEGGSSYPLNLILSQDDGSVAPFAPGSPVY